MPAGRPRKPLTQEHLRDLETARSLGGHHPNSPFGYNTQAVVARKLGDQVRDLYNDAQKNRDLLSFRYLVDGYFILTGCQLKEENACSGLIASLQMPGFPPQHNLGRFTLWGDEIPFDVFRGFFLNISEGPLRLHPFGAAAFRRFRKKDDPSKLMETLDRLGTIGTDGVDGALGRIMNDLAVSCDPSQLKRGIAGLRTSWDDVRKIGKREVSEMRAILRVGCIATRCCIGLFKRHVQLTEADADHVLSHGILYTAFDQTTRLLPGGQAEFWSLYEQCEGAEEKERLLDQYNILKTENEKFPSSHQECGAIRLFLAYLNARFRSDALYNYPAGILRWCRREGCTKPAFMWAPRSKDAQNKHLKNLPSPPNYCPSCDGFKASDQKARQRRARTMSAR